MENSRINVLTELTDLLAVLEARPLHRPPTDAPTEAINGYLYENGLLLGKLMESAGSYQDAINDLTAPTIAPRNAPGFDMSDDLSPDDTNLVRLPSLVLEQTRAITRGLMGNANDYTLLQNDPRGFLENEIQELENSLNRLPKVPNGLKLYSSKNETEN